MQAVIGWGMVAALVLLIGYILWLTIGPGNIDKGGGDGWAG